MFWNQPPCKMVLSWEYHPAHGWNGWNRWIHQSDIFWSKLDSRMHQNGVPKKDNGRLWTGSKLRGFFVGEIYGSSFWVFFTTLKGGCLGWHSMAMSTSKLLVSPGWENEIVTLQCRHCSFRTFRPWDQQTWTFWVVNPCLAFSFQGTEWKFWKSKSFLQGNGTVQKLSTFIQVQCGRLVPARAGRNHVPDPFCSVISIICTPISEIGWSKLSTCGMVMYGHPSNHGILCHDKSLQCGAPTMAKLVASYNN